MHAVLSFFDAQFFVNILSRMTASIPKYVLNLIVDFKSCWCLGF